MENLPQVNLVFTFSLECSNAEDLKSLCLKSWDFIWEDIRYFQANIFQNFWITFLFHFHFCDYRSYFTLELLEQVSSFNYPIKVVTLIIIFPDNWTKILCNKKKSFKAVKPNKKRFKLNSLTSYYSSHIYIISFKWIL